MKRFLLLALTAGLSLPTNVKGAFYSEVDLMTDETKYYAYIDSSTTTPNSIGIPEEATINVRCRVKGVVMTDFDAYIKTPTYNADNTKVALRWWGGGQIEQARWNESTDSTSLFVKKPKLFASKLWLNNSLVFQWTPYRSATRNLKFELVDYKKDLEKLMEVGCDFIDE
tara:strand:+ start:197 stop:703 length:507 start_codon:yes stop_codon:yes gene_type:complete